MRLALGSVVVRLRQFFLQFFLNDAFFQLTLRRHGFLMRAGDALFGGDGKRIARLERFLRRLNPDRQLLSF